MSTPSLHAVCIGIGAYQQLRPLTCPAHDAADMRALLTSGSMPARVELLADAAATRAAILGQLHQLAQRVQPNDTALVYLSGHGGRLAAQPEAPAFFCPVEASHQDLARTCISGDELTALLRTVRAARLLVLIDACYSGAIGEPRRSSPGSLSGFSAKDIANLVAGRGRAILAASRPDEPAWELHGMRNGLFTHYLLRGLEQKVVREDGTVWASELFGYVSRELRRHKLQTPYQKAVGEDFVVAVRQVAPCGPKVVLPERSQNERALRLAMSRAYNRAELALLCRDLGLGIEDLPGAVLENQILDLIDHCQRHGHYAQLIERVRADRPHLSVEP